MSWDLSQFDGKDVVFVGVGQGRSMQGFKDFVTKHSNLKSFTGVDKQLGPEPLAFLRDYDASTTVFVKNEAIPPEEMPVPYITTMNVFFALAESLEAPTVGVTGTKGKSTTAALTTAMLRAGGHKVVLGGNIGEFGESIWAGLDHASKDTIFVIELSSYQLTDMTHSPHVAIIINLYKDHTDWHGSLDAYWQAKQHIVAFTKPEDLFIYSPDFPTLKQWAEAAPCRTIALDTHEAIDISHANLYGEHNRLNALAARLIAREFKVSDKAAQQALDDFQPLPHRMELVAERQGHLFIDDAIGMTPESTAASLEAVASKYGQVGCLFLGGQDRDYDFRDLLALVAKYNIPNLVLFPDTIEKMKAGLPDGYKPVIFETKSMDEAVRWAAKHAPDKSVILLSTAAPSYSLWSGFPEKGDQFKAAANKLS
jgi:UDP-N-acetylmuramoylalanine--D-glutamate ligase